MTFKIEISLPLLATMVHFASAFFHSYEEQEIGKVRVTNTFRAYAFPLMTFASVLLIVAAILHSKRK